MPEKVVDGEQVQDEVDQHQKQHLDHRMVQCFKHQQRNTLKNETLAYKSLKNDDHYHQHKRLDHHHYRHMEVDELAGTD